MPAKTLNLTPPVTLIIQPCQSTTASPGHRLGMGSRDARFITPQSKIKAEELQGKLDDQSAAPQSRPSPVGTIRDTIDCSELVIRTEKASFRQCTPNSATPYRYTWLFNMTMRYGLI
jgi:hypothetical protein